MKIAMPKHCWAIGLLSNQSNKLAKNGWQVGEPSWTRVPTKDKTIAVEDTLVLGFPTWQ